MSTEIKNAIIESTSISTDDHGILTAWLNLDYGDSGQGFGGYVLYKPGSLLKGKIEAQYTGHFIDRCMQIAGVSKWEDMRGKPIRVRCGGLGEMIKSIGHILHDDWFNPSEDFKTAERRNKMETA